MQTIKNNSLALVLYTAILLIGSQSIAQDIEHNNLYIREKFMVNPAHAGNNNSLNAFVNARRQWAGFEGAPNTLLLGVHAPVNKHNGLGLTFQDKKAGIVQSISANMHYSHKTEIIPEHSLVFGMYGGIRKRGLNFSAVRTENYEDPVLIANDFKETNFIAGAGLRYVIANFEIDLVAPQLVYGQDIFNKHFIAATTLKLEPIDNFVVSPSVYVRILPDSKSQVDINCWAEWMGKFWVVLSTRTARSTVFGLGVNLREFSIGYTYEENSNKLAYLAGGSHEVLISMRLERKKPGFSGFWGRD